MGCWVSDYYHYLTPSVLCVSDLNLGNQIMKGLESSGGSQKKLVPTLSPEELASDKGIESGIDDSNPTIFDLPPEEQLAFEASVNNASTSILDSTTNLLKGVMEGEKYKDKDYEYIEQMEDDTNNYSINVQQGERGEIRLKITKKGSNDELIIMIDPYPYGKEKLESFGRQVEIFLNGDTVMSMSQTSEDGTNGTQLDGDSHLDSYRVAQKQLVKFADILKELDTD